MWIPKWYSVHCQVYSFIKKESQSSEGRLNLVVCVKWPMEYGCEQPARGRSMLFNLVGSAQMHPDCTSLCFSVLLQNFFLLIQTLRFFLSSICSGETSLVHPDDIMQRSPWCSTGARIQLLPIWGCVCNGIMYRGVQLLWKALDSVAIFRKKPTEMLICLIR